MTGRDWSRAALALFYGAAGIFHLVVPGEFLRITPDWVPFPRAVILATGVCELLGAASLLIPATRRWAGIGLALYAVCVFPANIKHALDALDGTGLPPSWVYHGPRLLLQPVIVWWSLHASGITDWPWRRRPA